MFDPKELLNTLTSVQGAPAGGILQNALAQAKSGLDAGAGGDVRQRVADALNQGAAMAGEAASQAGKVTTSLLIQPRQPISRQASATTRSSPRRSIRRRCMVPIR